MGFLKLMSSLPVRRGFFLFTGECKILTTEANTEATGHSILTQIMTNQVSGIDITEILKGSNPSISATSLRTAYRSQRFQIKGSFNEKY